MKRSVLIAAAALLCALSFVAHSTEAVAAKKRGGVSLAPIVAPLAAKVASIQSSCPGTRVVSGLRHTLISGTRRMSLHAEGKAVDIQGPYGCIYSQLRGWPGGYTTDAARMRHIHISYDAQGGREMGLAFRHGGHRHHRRLARRAARHHYATAIH
ncbi:hypothetical protein [Bradyrhizobium sp. SYSU BS000235]|uniref:hypothetical protein n=1 Tax=Bradyrhizobium sp. SYSU BS000235 TaxID=3411332 RepID=UPI003C728BF1